MADFLTASKITGINEGGYAFNHSDIGQETYSGISRKFWPNWQGWQIIDEIKIQYGTSAAVINQYAKANLNLQSEIEMFYKSNFWNVNKLDEINDQQIANSVYDFGVNSGVTEAAKMLQQCASVSVDGIIGEETIGAVNALNAVDLYNSYNAKRKAFYISLSTKPGQHQFLNSWLSRLKLYQTI